MNRKKYQKVSEYFKLDKSQWDLDFVDIFVDRDMPLFIDPWAIRSGQDSFSQDCRSDLHVFFTDLIQSVGTNQQRAFELLDSLHEPKETHLGFSSKSYKGRGVGKLNAQAMYDALIESEAVRTGLLTDLEDTTLYIEHFGSDKVSDIVSNVIKRRLIEYTQEQAMLNGIPTKKQTVTGVWNSESKEFLDQNNVELPRIENTGKLLLVPKGFVRKRVTINQDDFYRHGILEFEQARHLDARDSLCRTLKDGTLRPPTKKVLKEKIPLTKETVIRYVRENKNLLSDYKKKKGKEKFLYIPNKRIYDVSKNIAGSAIQHDIDKKISELRQINPGKAQAYEYERLILGILQDLLYPHLQSPKLGDSKADGRQVIDITFNNTSFKGFFADLAKRNVVCAQVFFECKNYSEDIKNPQFDQLLGRFDYRTSTIGFIVCRTVDDEQKIIEFCRDRAKQQQRYIIVLSDEDVIQLLESKKGKENEYEIALNSFFNKKLEEILNF